MRSSVRIVGNVIDKRMAGGLNQALWYAFFTPACMQPAPAERSCAQIPVNGFCQLRVDAVDPTQFLDPGSPHALEPAEMIE